MKAKEKVLRKVCCYTKEDEMMGHDDISISEAMEAMEEYHTLKSEEEANEKLKEARQYIHHNGRNPYHVDKALRIAIKGWDKQV